MRSPFGWSYPPGCSGPPDDDWAPGPKEERVFEILEDKNLTQAEEDEILKIVGDLEHSVSTLQEHVQRLKYCIQNNKKPEEIDW